MLACVLLQPLGPSEDGTQCGELAAFCVHPSYRGAGRGDSLLDYVEQQARDKGIRRLVGPACHLQYRLGNHPNYNAPLGIVPSARVFLWCQMEHITMGGSSRLKRLSSVCLVTRHLVLLYLCQRQCYSSVCDAPLVSCQATLCDVS